MTKKKSRKNKKIIEQSDVEPTEGYVPETKPVLSESDSDPSNVIPPTEEAIQPDNAEEQVSETEPVLSESDMDPSDALALNDAEIQPDQTDENDENAPAVEEEISPDDLMDDVRRDLIEENAKIEEEKKPSFWQKIGVGRRKSKSTDAAPPVSDVAEDSGSVDVEPVAVQPEDVGESIDDLIDMLETDGDDISSEVMTPPTVARVEEEAPVTEVEKADVNELKKRAFQGSTPEDKEESFSDVRSVALEGGEEVFVEVEVKTEDPVEERLKSFENALRPYRRYIYFSIAFIGVVVIVITSALLIDTLKPPPEPAVEIENLPYPVVLNIPGGLSFNLGRGALDNGRWDPRRPEWLEGTEICRWVAIPYSRQLEAVVRTLTQDDKLEVVMSNSDRLTYDVFSITQMSIEDMQQVSSNSPCLLLVLADVNTETRWVVTARP
jgi:hypothetical protein